MRVVQTTHEQLRATKDNPDILVSLILTKDMLLVARKPSYKTMHTLKFSAGLRAFPVTLHSTPLIGVDQHVR